MDLDPISRIILQKAGGGYYSIDWDGTCALVIVPGEGVGHAHHNGLDYSFTASNPAASAIPPVPLSQDAPYQPDAPT